MCIRDRMISMMMIMTITMFRKAQPGTEHQENAACPWEPSACRPSEAGLARKVIFLVVMMMMMLMMMVMMLMMMMMMVVA